MDFRCFQCVQPTENSTVLKENKQQMKIVQFNLLLLSEKSRITNTAQTNKKHHFHD